MDNFITMSAAAALVVRRGHGSLPSGIPRFDFPGGPPDPGAPVRQRVQVRRWEALADGMMDAAVLLVQEGRRSKELQSEASSPPGWRR